MPLLPSALPPKGEARRHAANDFLNLIALPLRRRLRRREKGSLAVWNEGEHPLKNAKTWSCTSFLFTCAIKLFYIENGLHLWKILSNFLIYISNKKIREDLKGKMLVSLLLERTKRHQKTEKRIENKSMTENSHCQWKRMENSIVWFEKMDGWWRSMTDGIHSIPT